MKSDTVNWTYSYQYYIAVWIHLTNFYFINWLTIQFLCVLLLKLSILWTFTFKLFINDENSNKNNFVELSSYSNVTIKRFRTNYSEQIRTLSFNQFFLNKMALFLWKTLKQSKVEVHFWDYSNCLSYAIIHYSLLSKDEKLICWF